MIWFTYKSYGMKGVALLEHWLNVVDWNRRFLEVKAKGLKFVAVVVGRTDRNCGGQELVWICSWVINPNPSDSIAYGWLSLWPCFEIGVWGVDRYDSLICYQNSCWMVSFFVCSSWPQQLCWCAYIIWLLDSQLIYTHTQRGRETIFSP